MGRFANKDRIQEVKDLKDKGLSYLEIAHFMNGKYGDAIWPKKPASGRDKAKRYVRLYNAKRERVHN